MKKTKKILSRKTTVGIKTRFDMNINDVIELLKIPTQKRTKYDIKSMQVYMLQHIEYFQKLNEETDSKEKIPKIISVLSYECFNKNEYIINFGEIGNKFYILLSGTVSIYKPSPKNMAMTLIEYVSYLVKIRDEEKNLLKFERIQNYNSNIDRVKLLLIDYNPDKLPYSSKKYPIVIEEERFVVKLGPGASFGEMALIKNEPRNADIIANERCVLGSVDKIDYRKIIKDMEELKVNSQLKSFKMDFPFFETWPSSRCFRILSGFTNENYMKEEYVYKQNSLPTHLYIIKKGEFEVTCDMNFSIYEKFVDYIHNNYAQLFNCMDDPLFWKEDNMQKKINQSYENHDSPFMSLPPISNITLSHKAEALQDLNENEKVTIQNNIDESEKSELTKVEDLESQIKYQNNKKRRIKIFKLEAPQMFGFIEAFELKRRFCNIKCESNEGEIQKIPFIEFLQLMPKDKKNRFLLEEYIFNRKKVLLEQLKNGTLAKLSFNYVKPEVTSINNYPRRNLDKPHNNKSKLLIRSKSIFTKRSEKNYIEYETNEALKVNENNNNNNKLQNLKTKNHIIYGFKKTLFSYSDKNTKTDINNLMTFLNNKNKRKINDNIKLNTNEYLNAKYLGHNSVSNILPTKSSLYPMPQTVGKNYNNFSSRKIINKISLTSKANINNKYKTEEKYLPNINDKNKSISYRNSRFINYGNISRNLRKNSSNENFKIAFG